MKRSILNLLTFAIVFTVLLSPDASVAQHRVVVRRPVVVRHPVVHTTLVVHPGHPIRRALPAVVAVRPAHRTVVVHRPLVYLPALAWTHTVVSTPPSERLVWQDSETIERDENWVDTNFGVDSSGSALFLDVNGTAQLNFAEVVFANGNLQVVDFNEKTSRTGVYKLLDFTNDRHVLTVRILAKSESDATKLAVYLSK